MEFGVKVSNSSWVRRSREEGDVLILVFLIESCFKIFIMFFFICLVSFFSFRFSNRRVNIGINRFEMVRKCW